MLRSVKISLIAAGSLLLLIAGTLAPSVSLAWDCQVNPATGQPYEDTPENEAAGLCVEHPTPTPTPKHYYKPTSTPTEVPTWTPAPSPTDQLPTATPASTMTPQPPSPVPTISASASPIFTAT